MGVREEAKYGRPGRGEVWASGKRRNMGVRERAKYGRPRKVKGDGCRRR
jgi:hypothetical protein